MPRSRTVTWSDPALFAAARDLSGLDFLRAIMNGALPRPRRAPDRTRWRCVSEAWRGS